MLFIKKKTKRNKKHYSKAIIIAMAVLVCLVVLLFIVKPVRSADVAFATKVTVNYGYDADKQSMQITDKGDIDALKELCYGKAYIAIFSTPSCGFGTVELVFEDSKHKVCIYPAYDGCCTMRLGDKGYYYEITSDDRNALERLLAKYDIVLASV